jgi:hypothetical protein
MGFASFVPETASGALEIKLAASSTGAEASSVLRSVSMVMTALRVDLSDRNLGCALP